MVMTATLVHYIERGHNCYDYPVIIVVTVTIVHDIEIFLSKQSGVIFFTINFVAFDIGSF